METDGIPSLGSLGSLQSAEAWGDPGILNLLVRTRSHAQKVRIGLGNRLAAVGRGDHVTTPEAEEVLRRLYGFYLDQEKLYSDLIESHMRALASNDPFVARLLNLRGLGASLAAQFLEAVLWPERFPQAFETVSKLWRWCGYAVIDGKAERRKPGESAHFVMRAKVTLYRIFTSFLRSGSPYAHYFYNQRDKYRDRYKEAGRDNWSRLGAVTARRKTIKLFLAHSWEIARREGGLPIKDPYIVRRSGGAAPIPPEDFGW